MNVFKNELSEKIIFFENVFVSKEYVCYENSIGNDVYFFQEVKKILVTVISKMYFFKIAFFPCEILNKDKFKDLDEEKLFLNKVIFYLKNELNVDWISSTKSSAIFDIYPQNSKWIPFGSHVINLTYDDEVLWNNVHSKHRNVIRKAEKEGVVIRECDKNHLDDFLELDEMTWRRSGKKSLGKEYYLNILENLGSKVKLYISYKDNIAQSGAIFYYDKDMCYYMYSASRDKPVTGAMNYLIWTVIKLMKNLDVKQFSFVGCRINEVHDSKYHGIQLFKERFGGKLKKCYMFKIIFNNKKYIIFNILRFLKNMSTKDLYDVIDQEWKKWH